MTLTETTDEHIVLAERGVPHSDGTAMQVIERVLDTFTSGWSPEEAPYQHPYVSRGQVYSALASSWDHKDVLDADMTRRLAYVDEVQRRTPLCTLHPRLRQQGAALPQALLTQLWMGQVGRDLSRPHLVGVEQHGPLDPGDSGLLRTDGIVLATQGRMHSVEQAGLIGGSSVPFFRDR